MFEISKCKIAWLKIDQTFYVECSTSFTPRFWYFFPSLFWVSLVWLNWIKQMETFSFFIIWFYSLGILDLFFSHLVSDYPVNFIFAIKMNYNFINKYDLTKTTCNGIHLPKLLDDFLYSLHIILRTLLVIQGKVYFYCLVPVWLKLGSLTCCYEKWLCF